MASNEILISLIEDKESSVPTCPSIDYIHRNLTAYEHIQEQFYNPQAQEALTCLVKTAIKSFRASRRETTRDVAQDLANELRFFFAGSEDVPKHLVIRTVEEPTAEEIKQVLLETYAGIVILNDLRSITPSFKYIYTMVRCDAPERDEKGNLIKVCLSTGTIPYLIEESLETSLREALHELPANEIGVRTVKSILLQLFIAVRYAAEKNVSNFPMEIKVRKVNSDSVIPVRIEEKEKFISTYGYVPVFERFHTVAVPVEEEIIGVPKSVQDEQNEIIEYVLSVLAAVNPRLRNIFPQDETLTQEFFDDITKNKVREELILSCRDKAECPSLKDFVRHFAVPYSRLHVYVRSGVERIDQLRLMLETTRDPDLDFLISGVMINYAELLISLAERLPEKLRNELFPRERYFRWGLTRERYIDFERGIIKPDLYFVKEALLLNYTDFTDPQYLKDSLDIAIDTGYRLQEVQRSLPYPDVSTLEDILASIRGLRDMITNINYYSNTNALIEKYRTYVGDYSDNLTEALQEAHFLKERYESVFAENPGVISQFIETVDSDQEFLITHLYNIFVEDIPDYLEFSLQAYTDRRTPEELDQLMGILFEEKLVASDPIPLIVGSLY